MTNPWWCYILVGYIISLVAGGLAVPLLLWFLRLSMPKDPPTLKARVPWIGCAAPHVMGFIERLIFTTLTINSPKAALLAMGGWIGLKMAASWQRNIGNGDNDKLLWASHAFISLMVSLVSMAFAAAGGAIALWLAAETVDFAG